MLEGITLKEFKTRFKTNADCMEYLVELKWGTGYECIKCKHQPIVKDACGIIDVAQNATIANQLQQIHSCIVVN